MSALTLRFTTHRGGEEVDDASLTIDVDSEDAGDEIIAIIADAFEEHAPGQVTVGGQYQE